MKKVCNRVRVKRTHDGEKVLPSNLSRAQWSAGDVAKSWNDMSEDFDADEEIARLIEERQGSRTH